MGQSRVAGRYAKALLDLAKERSEKDGVFNDMAYVHQAIEQTKELDLLLKSPIISQNKKASIFSALFEPKISKMSFEFLALVLKKRREADIGNIAYSYMQQYYNQNKVTEVKLASAKALTASNVDEIITKLKKQAGLTEVNVEQVINEDLIGGFVVEYDGKVLDASVKNSLNKIKKRFAS